MMDITYKAIFIVAVIHSVQCENGWYISNGSDVLFASSDSAQPNPIYHNTKGRIVGLAIDIADNIIFWSDISSASNGIYKANLNGAEKVENVQQIVSPDRGEINGITVDWHHKLIYWIDIRQRRIEVAKYDGSVCHILSIHGLLKPRGIYADPETSTLFWNDQGTREIEKSALDGSDRKNIDKASISSSTTPYWPNQMTVRNKKLYYVDGYTLDVVEYDLMKESNSKRFIGQGILAQYGADSRVYPPFGIAVDDSFAYISIWNNGKLVKISIDGNTHGLVFQYLGIGPIFSVLRTSANMQPVLESNLDPCASKSCSGGICLTSSDKGRCACQSYGNGSPKTLSTNENACSVPEHLLFYTLAEEGIIGYKSLDGSPSDTGLYIVGKSSRPVAVAFDSIHGYVYWSDVHERTIQRARLDGTNRGIFLSSSMHSIGIVDGLHMDLINEHLYYTNMGTINVYRWVHRWHKIEYVSLDGRKRRKTIVASAEKPRGLFVDYDAGYVYYTDWGSRPAVVRVNLDGSHPFVIRSSGLDNPNAVTVIGDNLYIIDSHYKTRNSQSLRNKDYPLKPLNGSLYQANKNGSNWKKVSEWSLQTPFGLTSYNESLFITDWENKSIMNATGPVFSACNIMGNVGYPMALAYSKRTTTPIIDSCNRSSCKDICVTSNGTTNCTCDSYTPFISNPTFPSNCSLPKNFILVCDFNSIKLVNQDGSAGPGDHLVEPQVITEGSSYFSNFVSLSYDTKTKIIYYTDVSRKVIYSSKLDGTERKRVLKVNKVIDGMDLFQEKLFWTAYSNRDGSINMTEFGSNNNNLIKTGLSRPRAIQVTDKYIYWTEWGSKPKVARMDIGNPNSFTTLYQEDLERPNGLHVDKGKIYIGDASTRARIIECNLTDSGVTGCKDLLKNLNGPKHIYSLKKANGNKIYFTDWEAGTLSMFDIESKAIIILAENLMRPTEIVLQLPGTSTMDRCSKDKCSENCVSYEGGYFCTCNKTETLDVDQKTCVKGDPSIICDVSQCKHCSTNEVCAHIIGETTCSCVCKVGFSGNNSCVKCETGYYKSHKGNDGCKECPSKRSSSDATGCQCNTGEIWNWITETCETGTVKPGSCPILAPLECPADSCDNSTYDQCPSASKCCSCQDIKKCMDPIPDGEFTQCVYQGTIYSPGEKFRPNGDKCIICTCTRDKTYGNPFYGYAECQMKECPPLDCAEDQQVLEKGGCCKTCDFNCAKQPITILGCQKGIFIVNLGHKDFAVWVNIEEKLTGHDNCKLDRKVEVTIDPIQHFFVWQKEPYKLTASAKALKIDGNYDKFTCEIQIKVKDTTLPTIECPLSEIFYPKSDDCIITPNPFFSDNVCGKGIASNCDLKREGESCLKLHADTNVTYSVTDEEGNVASCTYKVKLLPSTSMTCPPVVINHGKFECIKKRCNVSCSDNYVSDNIDYYTCSDNGQWKPKIPEDIQLACKKEDSIKIIGIVSLNKLPCPKYPKSLIGLGIKANVSGNMYARNISLVQSGIPLKVEVFVKGCSTTKDTKDFIIDIELISEVSDPGKKHAAKQDIENVQKAIYADIHSGKISWQGSGALEKKIDKPTPKMKCERGQIMWQERICVICPPGTREFDKKCKPCAKNTYNDRSKQQHCFPCPAGKSTRKIAATLKEDCIVITRNTDKPDNSTNKPPASDDSTNKPISSNNNNTTVIISIGIVAFIVVIIVIVITVVIVKRRRSSQAIANPSIPNPVFCEDISVGEVSGICVEPDQYEELPDADQHYEGFTNVGMSKVDDNPYMGLSSFK